jgi:hypothetical protein
MSVSFPLHNNVRSSAKAGFWNVCGIHLEQKSDKATQFSEFWEDETMETVGFLTNITSPEC